MTDPAATELDTSPPVPGLSAIAAGWLVFVTSGAVLMLEILSLRLVAPYLGLTLETSTGVIGFALGAIALGSWLGGRAADARPPNRMLGPAVLLSGVMVLFVGPAVRWTGGQVQGGNALMVLVITVLAILVPAALLSAVTPLVVKIKLEELDETGRVVGRLSGIGTVGALISTFVTGFMLVAAVPTTRILLALGGFLIVLGVVLNVKLRAHSSANLLLFVGALGFWVTTFFPPPCDVETAYHCAKVLQDPNRPSGRTLQLDTLFHSYVDLNDPTYLQFSYTRTFASVIDASLPGVPLDALHLGGGGLTIPKYLDFNRPGTESLVLEIDDGVVELDKQKLGLVLGDGIEVKIQDARVGLAQQPDNSRDVVVGDAFGGLSVPWHLTTRETVEDVQRILRDDGIYVLNVIDYAPLRFARAEAATVAAVFPHVALISRPDVLNGRGGDNLVIVGSDTPLPLGPIEAELAERVPEYSLIEGQDYRDFAGDAMILTDDFAPVDQLVTLYTSN